MSDTPINDTLTRETAGLDDAEHLVKLDVLSRDLERAANAMEVALAHVIDSINYTPIAGGSTQKFCQAALEQYRKLKP